MKKTLILIIILASWMVRYASAQAYRITLTTSKTLNGTYYLGQHFRDKYILVDSATADEKGLIFSGNAKLATGVYALLDSQQKKMFDFMVDDSRKFTISFDSAYTNAGMSVVGSKANTLMFDYLNREDKAREQAKGINERMRSKDAKIKAAAEKEMDALTEEMDQFEKNYFQVNARYRFTQLARMSSRVNVPETLPAGSTATNLQDWQAAYYRTHFWDSVDLSDHALIYTPQLFDKMNYYFFGVLYYQSNDTITHYANQLLRKIEKDSTMLRYFLEFITPKYERSTKMIGWDQVFVDLVKDYYLSGKCPWATDAEIYNKRQTIEYLSHSLIGSQGAELWMADTNQSPNPSDWISSHRFPQRFVMLWFWDPDCTHCQKQTAELKILYDSMSATGNKYFEVYAIGYESDVKKWKKYIKDHALPFVNVGGPNVNIDYQEAYNIHGAPTMILLNEKREIIMNKTLPTDQVIPFLKRYEQEHPL